ncbi:MAG TPA: bifunctional riboflavin kinase/FAD synthetase [Burkholderiaceae bacterium]|nr:bifunctional riboflavin kinase/FAD synthetase [Burkholderiaceae bacterium]
MQIFRGVPAYSERVPCALTIGNFDGVHRGHQELLRQVVRAAKDRAIAPAVMTFEPHPREFFSPQGAPARVANLRDKITALSGCGIERVFVMHFSRGFASMSAADFIDDVLVRGCHARWLAVGDDFRFGSRRTGDVGLLRAHAERGGYEVAQLPTVTEGAERVSSSAVRAALLEGDLQQAERLLGCPYSISGRVLHGAKLGRTIGFPTLNLRIAHKRPAVHGVFAVRVFGIDDKAWPGVASVGLRPTVERSGRWLLEVHLFDFAASIYGRLVRVEFIQRLRAEEKFGTLDQLTEAIRNDAAQARALFGSVAAS